MCLRILVFLNSLEDALKRVANKPQKEEELRKALEVKKRISERRSANARDKENSEDRINELKDVMTKARVEMAGLKATVKNMDQTTEADVNRIKLDPDFRTREQINMLTKEIKKLDRGVEQMKATLAP